MSDYTPGTSEAREQFARGARGGYGGSAEAGAHRHVAAQNEFDRWLAKHDAEVECAAAEKAMPIVREWLLEAKAEALEEFAERWATADGIEVLMFATDDVSAVQLTEKAMLARATDYRREEA